MIPTKLAALAAIAAPSVSLAAAPHILDNGRVHVTLADPGTGLTTADADRVDSITWTTSAGTVTPNLAANGGPLHCNDPQEYFGQAYGEAGSARPYLVFAGETSTWSAKSGQTLKGNTKVDTSKVCDVVADGGTRTAYTLSTQAARVNQLTVQRTFTFKTSNTFGNIRAYVPRLPISAYATVLWPNANGVVQTGNAGGCPGVCEVTDWNGAWFAEQNSAGQGMVVLRNPAKSPPAVLAFDNDSYSASNNSAVALKMPQAGWSGTVKETEALCFYDATTWSAADQSANKLPKGCKTP